MDYRSIEKPIVVDLSPQGSDWTCSLLPKPVFQTPKFVLRSALDSRGVLDVDTEHTGQSGLDWFAWWKAFTATVSSDVEKLVTKRIGVECNPLQVRVRGSENFVSGQEIELIIECSGVTLRRGGQRLNPILRVNIKNARETGRFAFAFI